MAFGPVVLLMTQKDNALRAINNFFNFAGDRIHNIAGQITIWSHALGQAVCRSPVQIDAHAAGLWRCDSLRYQTGIIAGYDDRIAAGNNLRVELLFYQFEMRVAVL